MTPTGQARDDLDRLLPKDISQAGLKLADAFAGRVLCWLGLDQWSGWNKSGHWLAGCATAEKKVCTRTGCTAARGRWTFS
jgi:hypothetical protein